MGCGSSVAQVSDSTRQGLFRPVRLLNLENNNEAGEKEGKMFLFGETRTQRKILEIDFKNCITTELSKRVRIPVPRVHYDPIQLMYQQSQEIFHLGVFGLSVLPPFNNMMALFLQSNLIFLCGGKDYDSYNIKNQAFFYSINDEQAQNQNESQLPNASKSQTKSKYSTNRFQKIAGMCSKRYGHTGIYVSCLKSILVFGGVNDKEEVLNTCQRYNIFDNSWKEISSMHVPRAFASCFLYKNKVYVFGGRSNSLKKTKKIEVFDFQAHSWEILNFKLHRSIEKCFTFSQKANQLFIVGGLTQAAKTKSCIKIDLQNRSYIWDSSVNYQYETVKGMNMENNIVLFGGNKNKIQKYQNGRWSAQLIQIVKGYQIEELNAFTFSAQSLNVASQQSSCKQVEGKNNLILLGNDEYPCMVRCDLENGVISIDSLPMSFKIHSQMSIIQYELGKYFITGGRDYNYKKTFKSTYLYNSFTQDVRQTVKMNERKYDFAISAHDGMVYIFGGSDEYSHAKNTCSKFNIENEHWQPLPTLRRARKNCFSQVINQNKIAVFGGENAANPVAGIQIFWISEKKFDIFEANLEIPNKIISAYIEQNNEDYMFIFNKDEKDSAYFLTTISLKEPKSLPLSKKNDIVNKPAELQKSKVRQSPKKEKLKTQLQLHIVEKIEGQSEQMPFINLKPQMIEIKPKKLESQSSELQKNHEPPLPDNDLEGSFEMEAINMSKSNIKNVGQLPGLANIDTNKLHTEENTEQKEEKIEYHSDEEIQKISNNNILSDKIESKSENQEQEPVPQQRIKTQSLSWLAPKSNFIVANRLQKIYFVTENECIYFDKKTGQNHAHSMVNKSMLRLDLIM